MKKQLIHHARMVTPFRTIEDGFLILSGRKIQFIGNGDTDAPVLKNELAGADEVFDAEGHTLLPGLIDIHTHGALGKDYSRTPELVFEDSLFRASKGVTGFLPTIGCFASPDTIFLSAKKLAKLIQQPLQGAKALGINMEGPFLYPELGAQDKSNCLWEIDLNYLERLIEQTGDAIKIMTISPELHQALDGIRFLDDAGVVPAIGHTLAGEDLLDQAIKAGARLVTHLFNTTYQPEQDVKGVIKPGVNEYLLIRDDIIAEFICDASGTHIHPVMLEILLRCKTIERLILISDSFMSPGLEENTPIRMPDGRSMVMRQGVNYQVPSNHIIGSAMSLDGSIVSLMNFTSTSLQEASLMASLNPARILGIDSKKGSLEAGKDGDMVLVDDNFTILATFVEGEMVYRKP